jgi:diacylglycerol kinase (ATP)
MAAGADRLVAAGGDGTLHLVAGVVLDAAQERAGEDVPLSAVDVPAVGVCPLGTGNDYVRTLGVPGEPLAALDLAATGEPARVDVIRATGDAPGAAPEWVVNAAAGGFSGEVDEALTREQKDRWGPLAFVLAAADLARDVPAYETVVRYVRPDGTEGAWTGPAVNVICAKGRTIGGGRRVAPSARLRGGTMELVILKQGPLPALAAAGARLLAGVWQEHPLVDVRRVRSARIRSTPGLKFNVDGDLWTNGPVRMTVRADALRVVR